MAAAAARCRLIKRSAIARFCDQRAALRRAVPGRRVRLVEVVGRRGVSWAHYMTSLLRLGRTGAWSEEPGR